MLKHYYLLFTALILSTTAFAQETVEIKNKLADNVNEIYNVRVDNNSVKRGLYQALYKKKTVIATGIYENNKRVGIWRFYSPFGQSMQVYDFNKNELLGEAPEDTTSSLRYFVDKEITPTDKITKPVKIGGRYYGFLPYLTLFKLPKNFDQYNRESFDARVELLISPLGRLSSYKVYLSVYGSEGVINMNLKLPNPDDLVFIPATYNGEAISSRVIIKCYVTNSGHLDFD